jgi:hypothetical protein
MEITLVGRMPWPVQLTHGYGYPTGKHGSPVNLPPNWLGKALAIPLIPTTADEIIRQQSYHIIIALALEQTNYTAH